MTTTLDTTLGPLLRARRGDSYTTVLAVLQRAHTALPDVKPTVVLAWIAARTTDPELRQLATDKNRTGRLVIQVYRNQSPTSSELDSSRLRLARRTTGQTLSSWPGLSIAKARKTRMVAAWIGSRLLAGPHGWDTTLVTGPALALDLGVSLPTAASLLRLADGSAITIRQVRPGGGKVVALRRLAGPAREVTFDHVGLIDELAVMANFGVQPDTDPAAVAITSVAHPIWAYSQTLNHTHWQALVAVLAGTNLGLTKALLRDLMEAGIDISGTAESLAADLDRVALEAGATERRAAAETARDEAAATRTAALELHRKRATVIRPTLATIMKNCPPPPGDTPLTDKGRAARAKWLAHGKAAAGKLPEQARPHLESQVAKLLARQGYPKETAHKIAATVCGVVA